MKILWRALIPSLAASDTACAETALGVPTAMMRPTIHVLDTFAPS
jgi:hypothetical protein